MESKIRKHFDEIITIARNLLHDIKIEEDYSEKRSLLKINGKIKSFSSQLLNLLTS